jgi:hypothetical protein
MILTLQRLGDTTVRPASEISDPLGIWGKIFDLGYVMASDEVLFYLDSFLTLGY